MALVLTEEEVRGLLEMPLAIQAVEAAFRNLARGRVVLHLRHRMPLPGKAFLHYMAAADLECGYAGLKIYTYVAGELRFLVPLFRIGTGRLVALVAANHLSAVRTGAASGVATKYMARAGARTVGIIGTGVQARTQLEALRAVRPIAQVRAFSRNPERRAKFAIEMQASLGVPVEPAASAEAAVRGADIVVTATTASRPVVQGRWLAPGAHLNAVGANFPVKRELDTEAVRRAAVIAADSVEQSRQEAGDLILGFGRNRRGWTRVRELADIVAGKKPGRRSERDITLFKSTGIAIEDVVTAACVYELALERGRGREIGFWEGKD
jgi:ornithine cyclodeaminase/alanine dehydrogenase-like protein (mu-crystallin family)